MKDNRTNFLVTLIFDEDSGIKEQVDTEFSFKNKIVKELQRLVKGKAIKHFIVADDAVINDKLKESQESVLDKIRDELDLETRVQVKHYTNTDAVINEVLDVIDKYRAENRE